MKRVWVPGLAVRKREVDRNMDVNLASSEDVVKERNSVLQFEAYDGDAAAVAKWQRCIVASIYHLSQVELSLSYFLVVSIRTKLEDLHHDGLRIIVITKCISVDDDLIPCRLRSFSQFSLCFVNGLEVSLLKSSIQGQEASA